MTVCMRRTVYDTLKVLYNTPTQCQCRVLSTATNSKPSRKQPVKYAVFRDKTQYNDVKSTLQYLKQVKQQQQSKQQQAAVQSNNAQLTTTAPSDNTPAIQSIPTQFSELHYLNKSLISKLQEINHTALTGIQQSVLPVLLDNIHNNIKQNILIHSYTGSGKTLCYLLPVLTRILNKHKHKTVNSTYSIDTVVVLPSTELIVQIQYILNTLSTMPQTQLYYIVQSKTEHRQIIHDLNKYKPYIVLGTPKQLHSLFFDSAVQQSHIEYDSDDIDIVDNSKLTEQQLHKSEQRYNKTINSTIHSLTTKPHAYTTNLLPQLNTLIVDEIDTVCKLLHKHATTAEIKQYIKAPPAALLLISSIHKYVTQSHSLIGCSATINSRMRTLLYRHGYNNTNPIHIIKPLKQDTVIENHDNIMLPTTIQHYYCIAPTYQQISTDNIHNTQLTIESAVLERIKLRDSIQSVAGTDAKRSKHATKLDNDITKYGPADITDKYRAVALLYNNVEYRQTIRAALVVVDQTLSKSDITATFDTLQVKYVWLYEMLLKPEIERTAFLQSIQNGTIDSIILSHANSLQGIDLYNLSHVFICTALYNTTLKDYIHYSGRTGRNSQTGQCITVVSPTEVVMLDKYQTTLQIKYQRLQLPELPEIETDSVDAVANVTE